MRLLSKRTPNSTHIFATLCGIDNDSGATSLSDIKEVEVNYVFFAGDALEKRE